MRTIFTSKFVKTLQTFSEAELKSFETWLRSPWCNTNKNLVRLLEKLRKYYPNFDDRKLTKEKLFKQVLPKGKFSDRRMNNLLSEGYLAAERFLIFQRLDENTRLQRELLAEEWQDRDLEDRFLKESQKEIDQIEAKPIKEWEDHLDLYRYQRQFYHHPNQSRRIRYGKAILQKMDDELNILYLLEKATILNEKIFRNRILQNENHETERDLQLWLQATKDLQHPAIEFYKMRFAYTEENRLEQYWKLRKAFMERYGELGKLQQKILLAALLNDTILLIKTKLLGITDVLPIYQVGLKSRVLFQKGKLTYSTYVTIVVASNTKRTFDFTHDFIDNYTQYIAVQFQSDCKLWAKAHTAYWQKQLLECIDLIASARFENFYFQISSRVLKVQVYFDLHLQDESFQSYLFSYLDAFEKWLQRGKVWSKTNKVSFLRFVQKSRTLAKYYADVNFKREKVEQLLDGVESVQALSWLKMKQQEVIAIKTKKADRL